MVDVPVMAGGKYHTRVFDQLCRMAVTLHVFQFLLDRQLQHIEPASVPTEIPLKTLLAAKQLVDTLTLQKTIMLEVHYFFSVYK